MEKNEEVYRRPGAGYLSFRTSLDIPDAFFTSMGLMLAAWTRIKMSNGLVTVGAGSVLRS